MSLASNQRWVRWTEQGFRTANASVPLCSACAVNEKCQPRSRARQTLARTNRCMELVPILTFESPAGLAVPFNTFRRGPGSYNRLKPGQRVALWLKDDRRAKRFGKVTETYLGRLDDMLRDHAARNHLMLGSPPDDAPRLLGLELLQLYGRNYASIEKPFSVVYVRPDASNPK